MYLSKRRTFVIVLLLFAFLLFASSVVIQEVFFDVTWQLGEYVYAHPIRGIAAFLMLAATSALLSPFSSAPLVPSAVVIWGAEKTFVLLFVGWLIGNITAYAIGYYLGYPVVKKIAPSGRLEKWMQTLSNRVTIWVALLFRLATPSETGYVFGTLHYNFFKYMFITFVSELPFAYVAVYVGEAFVTTGWVAFALFGVVWLAIVSGALYLLDRRSRTQ